MPPPQPELMEELVEEILLRFPPDDPASLARAALVCKLWCRLVCGAVFRRRFREFHRGAAPLLGLLYNDSRAVRHQDTPRDPDGYILLVDHFLLVSIAYFIPTTSFRPVHAADGRDGWHTIDARHGRVLLCQSNPLTDKHGDLCVWDPIVNEQQDLPKPPFHLQIGSLACAATACGDCDHLDCHREHFLVVAMRIADDSMHLSVYSSQARAWSKVTVCDVGPIANSHWVDNDLPGIIVRSALYILINCNTNGTTNREIVKFDLATWQVSTIHLPSRFRQWKQSILVMTDVSGGLGFVACSNKKLQLWSRVDGAVGDAGFVLTRVIDLRTLLPYVALIKNEPEVNGFAHSGANRVLFIRTCDGLYSIEINSSQVKKIANCCGYNDVIPYISFYTPTLRVQH